MMPQRQEDGQHRRGQQPPALLPLIAEDSQQEEEDGNAAYEHGSGGEGLGAPVQRQLLRDLFQVGLPGALQQFYRLAVGTQRACGSTPVEIGDHQVREFLPTIAPGRGVVQVQALSLAGGRSSAH